MPSDLRRADAGLRATGLLVLSALLVGTVWAVPYLPTNDGPESVFSVHMENHYADPGTVYRDVFVPTLQFASRGFSMLYGPFDAWLGWQRGLQVALSLTLLLVAWGFVALTRELPGERSALGFLGFPLALSWSFYMGFWAFAVSTGLGLFAIALALRLRAPTWRGLAALSLLLLLQASAHVFGAVLTGAVLATLALARAPKGRRLRALIEMALVGAPAMGLLAACLVVSRNLSAIPMADRVERFSWSDVVAMMPCTVCPGPSVRAMLVTAGVVAAVVVAGVRAFRPATSAVDRGLGIAAVALALASVVAPFQIPGWQAFSERFVPLAVALAIAVCPLEALARPRRDLVMAGLFALSVASLLVSYPFHRRLAALCPDALAGLSAPVTLNGTLLPVTFRGTERPTYDRIHAEVPLMAPLLHMGTLYAAAHGGVAAYSFASTAAVTPFALRREATRRPLPDLEHYTRAMASLPFHRDLAYRRKIDGELASFGVFYDEMTLFGALPEDVAVWRERGYVADWQEGTAFVAHFEPCTIDFTASGSRDVSSAVFDVRVGVLGLLSHVTVPAALGDDGLAHFTLTPAPCGEVAIHASLTCENADEGGNVVATITRTSRRVTCR